ncbi:CRTAC1 family protein [Aureliella helgolandensis]|uniref:FG-GAP repeat protein n=1 Tax=Aureliella helgolandensis TaxID=2527968 RepID=A0A518G8C3_9BACT|nr:CRTAC1 family protein [Aureliella helgolandensis]QDV24831.1 FG-GAP repeat protein [Aureliella helgolandensis]
MKRLLLRAFNFSHGAAATALLAMAALGSSGCRREPPASTPPPPPDKEIRSPRYAFEPIDADAGVKASYDNGELGDAHSILQSLGGGVGLLDFDLDGRMDLWTPGGGAILPESQSIEGLPSLLYRQQSERLAFDQIGAQARIDLASHYTHGCSVADCDSDGFPDVLISGYDGLQYFRNMGDGTFVECAQLAGLEDDRWSSSTAFGDFNKDGLPDLYVCHYVDWSWAKNPPCFSSSAQGQRDVCAPAHFLGLDDMLYLNDAQGGFINATATANLVPAGKGLGVIVADLDHDLDVDIYVANDTTENFFYLNDGEGIFEETGLFSGTALDHRGTPNGSMGLAILDFDGDQQPDIWVTNFENETFCLYRNQRNGNFQCVTERTGITAIGDLFVGFGTVAVDIELDGDEDLVVSNGHVNRFPGSSLVAQDALLLLNNGNGRLERADVAGSGYFSTPHRGRAVVSTDFNQDGLPDFVFSHIKEPLSILLNQSQPAGNWLSLKLIGRNVNRDAIGSRVEVSHGEQVLVRHVVGGGGYLSQGAYALHWGFTGQASSVEAKVFWPDGSVEQVELAVNQAHVVIQQPKLAN